MTDTTQEKLPPWPFTITDGLSKEQCEIYARECIATLKAEKQEAALQYISEQGQWVEETGRLKAENETAQARIREQAEQIGALTARLHLGLGPVETAQSQAAAMAGLLEDASELIKRRHGGSTAATDVYDAALAAWKGKQ